ncbi:hypothetical protein [Marinoscillum sp. MHG1-6]|uniref:hypothetical protein n=1 Tax=Marinoscillum sp. MHG1-6 TaxID=2959627 RepID=UPI0021574B88|nr:hypothetical protein [Marinoscillum sp. MHG1-6]
MEKKIRKRYNWAIVILSILVIWITVKAQLLIGYAEEYQAMADEEREKNDELKTYQRSLEDQLNESNKLIESQKKRYEELLLECQGN